MRKRTSRRSVLAGIAGSTVAIGALGTVSADEDVADDRQLYVVLAGGNGLETHIERNGFEVLHELADGSVLIVEGPSGERDELRTNAVVEGVITNETYTFDIEQPATEPKSTAEPRYEDQWDKRLVGADAAHDRATGDGTTIAVIDTGVSHSHPDIAPRLDTQRSRLFRYGRIHSGSDDVLVAEEPPRQYQSVSITTTTQPVASDIGGHGTHVAGIAAAPRNERGIVGMAPDATIVSLRPVFFEPVPWYGGDQTFGTLMGPLADMLLAIDYAVEIGVDVINLSLGQIQPNDSRAYTAYRRVVQRAIQQGIVVVAAAENYDLDLDQYTNYILPADVPGTTTVAATGPTDKRSHYSNYGNGTIDMAAPGGRYETEAKSELEDPDAVAYPSPTNEILSTVPEEIYGKPYDHDFGTSMAAPQVAGLASLLRELDPDCHPRRIQQAIAQSAVDLSGDYTDGLGAGRIDAPAAIDRIERRL